jgi:hypothetical protein
MCSYLIIYSDPVLFGFEAAILEIDRFRLHDAAPVQVEILCDVERF